MDRGKISIILAVSLVVCGLPLIALAQKSPAKPNKPEKLTSQKTSTKEAVGTVTWIGGNTISITVSVDEATGTEEDALFFLDKKKVQVQHRSSLKQIKPGDIVRIRYEETASQFDSGRDQVRRQAVAVIFVKAGVPKTDTTATGTASSQVIDSATQGQ